MEVSAIGIVSLPMNMSVLPDVTLLRALGQRQTSYGDISGRWYFFGDCSDYVAPVA